MKQKLVKIACALLIAGCLMTACKKETGETNEEELITTIQLTFAPVGGGTSLTYEFSDLDGPGGAPPTQDEIVLAPSKTYNVSVQVLNESVSPAEDITEEVEEESDAHRFYYEPSAGSNITVSALDNDASGVPLGITSTWTTDAASTGTIIITLRHYPGNPPGKETSDPVNSGKSGTDVTATFNTKIQ